MRSKTYNIVCSLTFILMYSQNAFAQNSKSSFAFQNSENVIDYLSALEVEYSGDDIFIFESFDDFVEFNAAGFLKGPLIHVFNSDGIYLEDISPDEVVTKLSSFKKIKKKPNSQAIHISTWSDGLVNIKDLRPLRIASNVDYYFVLNWALFINRDSNKELFKWYKVLKRQMLGGQSIQLILLDMDLQEGWNLSAEKKTNILKQANR